jgi:hypothetical protein
MTSLWSSLFFFFLFFFFIFLKGMELSFYQRIIFSSIYNFFFSPEITILYFHQDKSRFFFLSLFSFWAKRKEEYRDHGVILYWSSPNPRIRSFPIYYFMVYIEFKRKIDTILLNYYFIVNVHSKLSIVSTSLINY